MFSHSWSITEHQLCRGSWVVHWTVEDSGMNEIADDANKESLVCVVGRNVHCPILLSLHIFS